MHSKMDILLFGLLMLAKNIFQRIWSSYQYYYSLGRYRSEVSRLHLEKPQAEKLVSQEERQYSFDQLLTTDDHGMHIIGNAVDQNGTSYYIEKIHGERVIK
ncbi:MAG: hypothetical protein IPO85_17050 [Saprospiraceae bacterium]|uniref:Uncharacterized protein n=1 Tax=Candidatus Defluviibacterium haderslevense TaxID=2981993 RepID=A0A9D7SC07_9BACT|nr:hypothetical protein [Candidatus Defluviibacterium haderslevense]